MSTDIRTTLRGPVPRLPFERIANVILGKDYGLSLVLCGDTLSQRLNKKYRKKEYRPNVLSFPLSKTEGEIFLNVRCANREAKRFEVSLTLRCALLFVHGCFHLKGLDHGKKMEQLEKQTLSKFGFE